MAELLPVGATRSPFIRFVVEDGSGVRDEPVTKRDWDVTDPEARDKAARETLGAIDESWRERAQWFIDAEKNAAALLVYRPDLEKYEAWRAAINADTKEES